ncbi:hypothetical protein TTHERM_01298510 (macronuclear) [Tetrahymena thermophila SB210]|uniref:Uncharacterized protein n=1 Tax=Tetrahymena thermophila (strain SB210) TaxID=312017 RepID=Q22A14_TETTS|nr:hypothetical protein TTHERM_01298510 [Tetrahymena thermophila SB210]EAR82128.1 hypothetical protein TTHERM_01298510 [Tetrahymena thermophila SB210]|eukprot:XP_001029791.1 hypothetical protein TTHERM_01298510 [Tetrahymena thermophila SB210]
MKKATTTTTTSTVKKTTTTTTAATKTTSTTASKPAGSTAVKKAGTTATKTSTSTAKSGTSAVKSTTTTKAKTDTKSQNKQNAVKIEEKKIEVKQDEIKQEVQQPVEQKKEEQKVEKQEVVHGEVTITYNHYKNKFPIINGQITSQVIDDEYCMSAVFLGNFKMHLSDKNKIKVEEKINSDNVTTFSGLITGETYGLQIEEDDAAEAQRESKAFVAEKKEDKLRGERKEGCSCLYGNPCVDSGVCNDWKNRFEVAKKNGWKGFQ